MEANKWYKKLSNGKYWLLSAYTGVLKSTFVSPGHDVVDFYNTDFDTTPHTRTTFPNMPDLIERVSKIDPAAAEWLEFGDHSDKYLEFESDADDLDDMFVWEGSPQGSSYWNDIDRKIRNYEQRSVPMQKEYEYESTTADITLNGISNYNPCDTEFGKFTKWFLARKALVLSSKDIVNLLVSDNRFSWLNWLSENTPFVKRAEKKEFKFGPENLKLEFRENGRFAVLQMRGQNNVLYNILHIEPNKTLFAIPGCVDLPVPMDGDKIAIK